MRKKPHEATYISIRLPDDLRDAIDGLRLREWKRGGQELRLSSWIRRACEREVTREELAEKGY